MAHELYENRWVTIGEPAWHGLGKNPPAGTIWTAEQGLVEVGEIDVRKVRMAAVDDYGNIITTKEDTAAIYRFTPDKEPKKFGVVSPEYTLIRPRQFAQIYDLNIGRPIETLGFLRDGRIMVISCKLPQFDVRGDEHENYWIGANGMDGMHALEMHISNVRVVCMNTLRASIDAAVEMYYITHDESAAEKASEWMRDMYERSVKSNDIIRQAYEVLAGAPASPDEAMQVVDYAWVVKPQPRNNAPEDVMKDRLEQWETSRERVVEKRAVALDMFMNQSGTALDTDATKGTHFGLWNAICQIEDNRKSRNDQALAYQELFGSRAEVKERGFEMAMSLVTGQELSRQRK